ncbi:hypothetical protein D9M72_415730 [compost metagenome]
MPEVRRQAPDEGQPVGGHGVLGGPAEGDLSGAEAVPGEGGEPAVPFGGVNLLRGGVPFTAGKDVADAVDVGSQDGAHRFFNADKRGIQRGSVSAGSNDVRAVRVGSPREESVIAERHIRGDNDFLRPDRSALRVDDSRRAVPEPRGG